MNAMQLVNKALADYRNTKVIINWYDFKNLEGGSVTGVNVRAYEGIDCQVRVRVLQDNGHSFSLPFNQVTDISPAE